MLESLKMENSMVRALIFGKMETFMKAVLKMATSMDLVFDITKMEEYMKETGRMTKDMDLECSLLLQVTLMMLSAMKATLKMM